MKNVEDIYELSPLQHGMLFHTLYAPISGVYIEQFVWTLDASLNVAAFKRAWQRVIERHAVLRTSFNWRELDKPVQIVHRKVKLPWKQHNWRWFSPDKQQKRLQRFLQNDRRRGYDLIKAPVMRLALFNMGETYQFVLSHHHILMDGWCGPLILGEVLAYYEAFCQGEDLDLPLPRPYRDYIAWLQKQDLSAAETFWRENLKGFTTPTALGIDESPGNFLRQEGVYAEQRIQLPSTVSDQLKRFARDNGITFNTVVQGAWGLLLSCYSGQEDAVFGTVVSGRPAELTGVETMTGLFVNTLPMRVQVPPQVEILPWLKQIQAQQVEMRQYEYTPLVNIQGWSAIPRGTPLFENILVFENYPVNTELIDQGSTLEIKDFRAFEQTNYPLTMMVMPGTFLKVIYDQKRFNSKAVDRLLGHFQTILEGISSRAYRRLADIPILTGAERQQILVDWNATHTDEINHHCIHELFEIQVERNPRALAVTFQDQSLSYAELNRQADQWAHILQSLGVGPDVLVGLCAERSLEMLVGLLAILKAGGAYVPLDPTYPQERLAFMLADAHTRVLLTQDALLEKLPAFQGQVICLDGEKETLSPQRMKPISKRVTPQNLAYAIYTSGSTGKPKGVQISHEAVVNFLDSMSQQPGFSQQDVLLAVTTLSFDIAGLELWLPLVTGGQVVIVNHEDVIDGASLAALMAEKQATVLQATPVIWRLLLEAGWKGNRNLTALCGGEAFPIDLANQLNGRVKALWNMYGPTETTIWSSMYPVVSDNGLIPIGRPIANTEMYILDRQLNPVPIGVSGNLYIGGIGVARGYLKRPALTAEKFIPNPFSDRPGMLMYDTGDLARYLSDGNIEFLGREDLQVKMRGLRIELGEIEAAINQHPGVRESAVMVRKDKGENEQLVAYLVPDLQYSDPALQENWEIEQTVAWQAVWDGAYQQPFPDQEPTFNISGWNSRITGDPIPAEEMRQWVDNAVQRILDLQPKRVWEIGCGTGLLLFRVAPHCTRYLGTDFSEQAIKDLQSEVSKQHLSQVRLSQRIADDFIGIETGAFDTVILNSVIQYFPSVDYLLRVLENAVNIVAPGGSVFIGDVRSLPLLQVLHTAVELHHAPDSLSVEDLWQRVVTSMSQEQELVIAPGFFYALRERFPRISHVEVLPKRGCDNNELSKFRYEVILHIEKEVNQQNEHQWVNWDENLNLGEIQRCLTEDQPDILGIRGVPNTRVLSDVWAVEWLAEGKRQATVGELREARRAITGWGIEIEDLWQLGDETRYQVEIAWSGADQWYDVVFHRVSKGASNGDASLVSFFPCNEAATQSWQEYISAPLQRMPVRELLTRLQHFLGKTLPDYMVPTSFVLLEKMPLTLNGKVDRKALPAPGESRPETAGAYVAPRTATEGKVATILQRLLGVDQVGSEDDFFRMGGHSLTAIQLINNIRRDFDVEMPLNTSYEMPTVAELARQIDAARGMPSEEE